MTMYVVRKTRSVIGRATSYFLSSIHTAREGQQ